MLIVFAAANESYATKTNATLHLNHKPGETLQVDWADDTAKVVNTDTDELMPAYVFSLHCRVAVMRMSKRFFDERRVLDIVNR